MKTDAQIINEMLLEDIKKQQQGELNRYNALVVASTSVKKGNASSKGGLLTMTTDAIAVGEVSGGDRIAVLFLINAKDYKARREVDEAYDNN